MSLVKWLGSLLALACVATIGSDLWRMWRLTSIGKGLAQAAVAYQHPLPAAPYNILVLGDSTAVGTGSSRPEDSIAGRLGTDFGAAQLTNLAHNGYKLKDLGTQLATLPPEEYGLIVIQIGSNDIIRWTPLSQVTQNLTSVLAWAKNHSPQVVVLHSGDVGSAPFFPWWLKTLLKQRSLQVRGIFQRLTEQYKAVYVDLYGQGADNVLLSNIKQYYSADLLHPSGEGYGVWYRYLRAAMAQAGLTVPTPRT